MSALNFVLTNAGRAAISQVGSLGPVVISQVALGSNGYTATVSQTALQAQIKRLTPAGSSVPTAGTIHITVQDDSADAYTVREIGIYTSTGALFAVYSQTDSILIKASTSVALFALDIVIANVPAGSVTIGNATFQYPPATESVKGVAELATNSEVQTGTDAERIVTPAGLASRTATETRTGIVELATNTETQAGTDTARAVTPAGLASRTANTDRAGIVELATNTETQAGTDTARAVTPASLASAAALFVPPGAVMPFAMNAAPSGWLPANGGAVSRTVFAPLFAAIGTTYGAGDGSTTFALPDLRGYFVRGSGTNAADGTASGTFGERQQDAFKDHKHTGLGGGSMSSPGGTGGNAVIFAGSSETSGAITGSDSETRPRNIAMLYCIKI
jgi:microcystin-dependent protein